jgi:hypothetical protein
VTVCSKRITGATSIAGAVLIAAALVFNLDWRVVDAGFLILNAAAFGFVSRLVATTTQALETIRQAGYDAGYEDGYEVSRPKLRNLSAVGAGSSGGGAAQQLRE